MTLLTGRTEWNKAILQGPVIEQGTHVCEWHRSIRSHASVLSRAGTNSCQSTRDPTPFFMTDHQPF